MSRNHWRWLGACLLLLPPPPVSAGSSDVEEGEPSEERRVEVHGLLDLRFAAADEPLTWLDGGFGRTRFGGRDRDSDFVGEGGGSAFHLAQASLVLDARVAPGLKGHLQVNLDAEEDRRDLLAAIGIVEGFLSWNRQLTASAGLRLRGGVTIPPFSLEHPETAWSTRYTVTPSAIGSWIGEELKSTGVEGTVTLNFGFNQLDLQGAVFSGNDSTGALLAWRGWALHDRQGVLGDELPMPPVLSLTDPRFFAAQGARTEPFHEIDGRPGYHAQGRFRLGGHATFQGGYYDSNGDVTAIDHDPKGDDYTWDTRFALAGVQLDFGRVTLLGQYLDGRAEMGFLAPATVDAPIRAAYGLVSVLLGGARVSARYDDFEVGDEDLWREGKDLNLDGGWAATFAWIQSFGEHHRLMVEAISLKAEHPFNQTAGESVRFTQNQVQAGYRLVF